MQIEHPRGEVVVARLMGETGGVVSAGLIDVGVPTDAVAGSSAVVSVAAAASDVADRYFNQTRPMEWSA